MGHARETTSEVPAETARVARAAFPKGNPYLQLRDELGPIYRTAGFRDLFSRRGQPAESPGLLAMVTVLQYAEGLTDRQAADAVRGRLDWKYLLGLELTDAGFDFSVLSEFRGRLVAQGEQLRLFEVLLDRVRTAGLLTGTEVQRSDSTHVLAAIRIMNRLEIVGETMRQVLEVLAVAHPVWLAARMPADWFERYGQRFEEYRLPRKPAEREALAVTIGADGLALLDAIDQDPEAPQRLPAVEVLRQVWDQQYRVEGGQVIWRRAEELPPAEELIQSPFDPDARWSVKRSMSWTGYKAHLTESCGPEGPHLITDVQTTLATMPDVSQTQTIQAALVQRGLVPKEHLVDQGYPDAGALISSAEQGIDLVAPVAADTSWQARDPTAYDLSRFHIDWQKQRVRCPQGHSSTTWSPSHDSYGNAVIHVRFAAMDCDPCPAREKCTHGRGARSLKLRPQAEHEALQAARERQTSDDFRASYRRRAGVEGTISQGVRANDLRHSRYRGLEKTCLHSALVATAMNLTRVATCLAGERPRGTRHSPLLALKPA